MLTLPSPVAAFRQSPAGRSSSLRLSLCLLATLIWLAGGDAAAAAAESTPAPSTPAPALKGLTIRKVLVHLLDTNGVHTLHPSLLERDAYQGVLRKDASLRGGMQFDILVSALPPDASLVLRVEARGMRLAKPTHLRLEETLTNQARFRRWRKLSVRGSDYTDFGEMSAWRATLWHGTELVAEQKSFLW